MDFKGTSLYGEVESTFPIHIVVDLTLYLLEVLSNQDTQSHIVVEPKFHRTMTLLY